MGYLLHIVLALLAQGLVELGLTHKIAPTWCLIALAVVPHGLAQVSDRLFIAGHFKTASVSYRVLTFCAPLLFLGALALFGWHTAVERWTGATVSLLAWPGPSIFVLLAPYALFEILAIDARSRVMVAVSERSSWRAFQLRMLLSGALPILVYVIAASLIGANEELRVAVEEVALYHAIFATVLIIVLGLLLPFLIENAWETAPFPAGAQRDLLLSVAARAHFASPKLRVWRTGNQMANAAIVGVTPGSRVVLFSDLLLAQMSPIELAAVFAHEMGHAVRRHVPIFLCWVLAFFLLGDFVAGEWFEDKPVIAGAIVLAFVGAWAASFGWLSRRFELEADLHSLDLMGETRPLVSALERVGGRLRDVAGWRHFSTAERVRFLEHAQIDPRVAERLRRTLRAAARIGVGLFVLAVILQIGRLFATFEPDRVRADLRLGHYAAAAERAHDLTNLDHGLALLVQRARTLGTDDVGVERVDREVRAALTRADKDAAAEWLELLALRTGRSREELAHNFEAP